MRLLKFLIKYFMTAKYIAFVNRNLVIMPSYVAKGLEFDSVISYNVVNNKYEDKDKYLYYVTCTRAQHNLIIYNAIE